MKGSRIPTKKPVQKPDSPIAKKKTSKDDALKDSMLKNEEDTKEKTVARDKDNQNLASSTEACSTPPWPWLLWAMVVMVFAVITAVVMLKLKEVQPGVTTRKPGRMTTVYQTWSVTSMVSHRGLLLLLHGERSPLFVYGIDGKLQSSHLLHDLIWPQAMVVLGNDTTSHLVVADWNEYVLQWVSLTVQDDRVVQVTTDRRQQLEFRPWGLHADDAKRVLIVPEFEGNRFSLFDYSDTKLASPVNIIDIPSFVVPHAALPSWSRGRYIINDLMNNQVVWVSTDGSVLKQVRGDDVESHVTRPSSIVMDDEGKVIVADWGSNSIQLYDHDGTYLCHLMTKEDGILQPAVLLLEGKLLHLAQGEQPNYEVLTMDYLELVEAAMEKQQHRQEQQPMEE